MGDKALCFQKIDDCLLDENKIVTYKWISQFLGIHVNRAKQLLEEYIKESATRHPSFRERLEVTYLISGTFKGQKGLNYRVVKEKDLPRLKRLYSVVISEHVYSIEMVPLPDLNALFAVDYVEADMSKGFQGAIKCSRSVKKTAEEKRASREQAAKQTNKGYDSDCVEEPMDQDDNFKAKGSGDGGPAKFTSTHLQEPMEEEDIFAEEELRMHTPPPWSKNHVLDEGPPEKKPRATENNRTSVRRELFPTMPTDVERPKEATAGSNTSKASTSATTAAKPAAAKITITKPTPVTKPIVTKPTAVAKPIVGKPTTSKPASNKGAKWKKSSKKVFGDNPDGKVQTSLTSYFKKS